YGAERLVIDVLVMESGLLGKNRFDNLLDLVLLHLAASPEPLALFLLAGPRSHQIAIRLPQSGPVASDGYLGVLALGNGWVWHGARQFLAVTRNLNDRARRATWRCRAGSARQRHQDCSRRFQAVAQ